jgi:hypothetical protein
MKNRNWFWGIIFLLSAIVVIATQTGAFGKIGVLSILASVMLIAIIIQSAVSVNFFGVFLPMAFLYMIYKEPLNLPEIQTQLLLLSSVLASIGFSILFRAKPKKKVFDCGANKNFSKSTETIDDNNPYAKVNFGASSKYVHSDCLKSGNFSVSFGALEVYLDQAQIDPNGAEIFIDCSFGGIEMYIPRHWRVVDNLQVNLAGVDNNTRLAKIDENSPVLTLSGNIQLSGVEIKYV